MMFFSSTVMQLLDVIYKLWKSSFSSLRILECFYYWHLGNQLVYFLQEFHGSKFWKMKLDQTGWVGKKEFNSCCFLKKGTPWKFYIAPENKPS